MWGAEEKRGSVAVSGMRSRSRPGRAAATGSWAASESSNPQEEMTEDRPGAAKVKVAKGAPKACAARRVRRLRLGSGTAPGVCSAPGAGGRADEEFLRSIAGKHRSAVGFVRGIKVAAAL